MRTANGRLVREMNVSNRRCFRHFNGIQAFLVLVRCIDAHCHDNAENGSVDALINYVWE